MKNWKKNFDSQQRIFYPFLVPFIKAMGLAQIIPKRQMMQLEEAINPFLRLRNRKIIFYIRIYTLLVNASQFNEIGKKIKCRNILRVASDMTRKSSFSDEKIAISRLHKLVLELIAIIDSKESNDPEAGHFKAKSQLAENICILRLMKV